MRINIYAEEVTTETEIVRKSVYGHNDYRTFYGVRMFLDSPDSLHNDDDDDDRSAITIFIPWTKDGGYDVGKVEKLLDGLCEELGRARGELMDRGEKVR